ncbi:alanine racemase domain-containing protein, partial [Colletotrichum incanum]
LKSLKSHAVGAQKQQVQKTYGIHIIRNPWIATLSRREILKEVLYGPLPPVSIIPLREVLSKSIHIQLMIDHKKQLTLLENFAKKNALNTSRL